MASNLKVQTVKETRWIANLNLETGQEEQIAHVQVMDLIDLVSDSEDDEVIILSDTSVNVCASTYGLSVTNNGDIFDETTMPVDETNRCFSIISDINRNTLNENTMPVDETSCDISNLNDADGESATPPSIKLVTSTPKAPVISSPNMLLASSPKLLLRSSACSSPSV